MSIGVLDRLCTDEPLCTGDALAECELVLE